MPGGCPLPEYSSVIRWTVQDVINWLSQNKLKDSIPNFRLSGVDGNKLLNCTDTDLAGISCPEKEIRIIMSLIKQVQSPIRPFSNSTNRYTKSSGYVKPRVPSQSESDDDCTWDSDEFESDHEEEPVRPDRPTRGLPPPMPRQTTPAATGLKKRPPPPPKDDDDDHDDYLDPEPIVQPSLPPPPGRRQPPKVLTPEPSEELYEDPDAAIQVQHIHPGPLPPLPSSISTNKNKAPPLKFRQVPPPRNTHSDQDSADTDDPQVYEDPDEDVMPPPPPVPKNVPKRTVKLPPTPTPTPVNEEEVYEDPDPSPAPVTPNRNFPKRPQTKLPPEPVEEEEDYEEPDAPPRPGPPNIVPVRKGGKQPPPIDDQEVYEEPDLPASVPSKPEPRPPVPKHPVKKKNPPKQPVVEQANSEDDADDYLDMNEGPQVPKDVYEVPDVEPQANSEEDQDDYLDMNEGPQISQAPVVPPPIRKNNKQTKPVAKVMPKAPSPPHEETYEEPDLPTLPKPPKAREIPKPPSKEPLSSRELPKPPAPSKGSYTQVNIKLDHGAVKPTFSNEAAAASPGANINLEQQKWFYGNANRNVITKRLEELKVNGMYIIRNSTKSPTEPYTLQIYYGIKVYNLSIRVRPDGKYAIGANKEDEKGFSSLLEMINFFKQNFLVLHGGSQTKLLRSLPKE